jgi:NADPH:quinone reductase-like Zn-dependent oxidoreductase
MNAAYYDRYGGPVQLVVREVPQPALRPDHVLIRVVAASINSWDYDMLRGNSLIIRALSGWTKPRYKTLGCDVAGIVEKVGSACRDWKAGDEVFGDIASAGFGSFAEYVAVPEKLLARKPASLTFQQASALPQAGLLAVQGLRHHGDVKPDQRVLINGAGGGVGPIALTYAKSKGAHVTCVDRKEKFDVLLKLGADDVIDFTTTDYTRTGEHFDKILDVIALRSTSDYRRALTSTGVFSMIGGSMGSLLFRMMVIEPFLSRYRSQKLGIVGYRVTRGDLEELARMFVEKTISVVIDRTFPLLQVRDAFEYFASGNFKGKIVIDVRR